MKWDLVHNFLLSLQNHYQQNLIYIPHMKTGKTYQALAIADFYRDDWPLLVCTTAGTRYTLSNYLFRIYL